MQQVKQNHIREQEEFNKYGLDFYNVYELCNKYRWFTQGTTEQYNKMFRMVEEKEPIEEIATIIAFCTDEDKWCRRDILTELKEVAKRASVNEC